MRTAPVLAATLAAVTLAAAPAHAQRANGGATARPVARTTAAAPAAVAPAAAGTYQIDAAHSELTFRVRHLLGRVNGTFGQWAGTIAIDPAAPARSTVDVTIQTASIDTRNARRDEHLRAPDFFAADSFPTIAFRSTRVTVQGRALRVAGDLTMRGVTKPVVLVGQYGGQFRDPWGATRTAFTASTTVDRTDFGVAWNKAVEAGTMLGDEVTIDIAVEAVRQEPKADAKQ